MFDKLGHYEPFDMSKLSKQLEQNFITMSADSVELIFITVDNDTGQCDHFGVEGSDNVDGSPSQLD